MFKDILKAILLVVLPLVFSRILELYPDFPLTLDSFVALFIWVFAKLGLVAAFVTGYHSYSVIRLKYFRN